jgi:tRNA threonylcarbamoyladenosine biosynthesis protein TsaB
MNTLAIDTCLGAVSAAVRWRSARGEWLLREAYEPCFTGHAERLFPLVADVMQGSALPFSAIDRIAVTIGPGTFTGVRAGIAAARAFALAAGKPVVGMTSLAVMAQRAQLLLASQLGERALAVAVDARRDMVYFQLFRERTITATGNAQLLSAEAAAHALGSQPVIVVGSAAAAVAAAGPGNAEVLLPDLQPHARMLAIAAPDLVPMAQLTPLYLREPDARPPASLLGVQP